MPPLNIDGIKFEVFQEIPTLITKNANEITKDTQHIDQIRKALQYQELNAEESNNLWKAIGEYPDIFHLEWNSFPSTATIQHEIHLKEDEKPINIRPFRLPYAHRQEIVKQMEELENNNIRQPLESLWNAPLIVILKKQDAQRNWK